MSNKKMLWTPVVHLYTCYHQHLEQEDGQMLTHPEIEALYFRNVVNEFLILS